MSAPSTDSGDAHARGSRRWVAIAAALGALLVAAVAVLVVVFWPHSTNHRHAAASSSSATPKRGATSPAAQLTAAGPKRCLAAPSACGFPDATNTGVPATVKLSPKSGSLTITKPGTVIDGLEIRNGRINVNAPDVTIKNTKVTTGAYFGIHLASSARHVTIENVTIIGTTATGGRCDVAIDGGQFVVERVNISGCADGIHAGNTDQVLDSYVHDFSFTPSTHNDGIQVFSAAGVLLDHNTIDFGSATRGNAAIFLQPTSGVINDVQIIDNLVNGGGFTVYVEKSSDVTVVNNRFGRHYKWAWLGVRRTVAQPYVAGNMWDDSSVLIPPP